MNGMLWKQEVMVNSIFLLIYYFLWFDKMDLSIFDDKIYHQDNCIESYVSVTPKMVRKVVMNLDLSKASGPDCIPVVVLT